MKVLPKDERHSVGFPLLMYVLQIILSGVVALLCLWDMLAYHSATYNTLFSVHIMLLILSALAILLLRMIQHKALTRMYSAAAYIAIYPLMNLAVTLLVVTGILPGFFSGIQGSYYALLLLTQGVDIWKLFVDYAGAR